ncbi:hypothetical protein RIF29_19000 [Crotalaria pallida]|uniref:non-specific serine/threonine protein kinase n=1 Tax=Crotalaria pallida TaxID=3830 RepID=A0AAN9F173_CROPI
MATTPEGLKDGILDWGKSKGKNNKDIAESKGGSRFWPNLRFFLCCMALWSKAGGSSGSKIKRGTKSSAGSGKGKEKSISSTNSQSESESESPRSIDLSEELKAYPHLRRFSYNQLKLATGNFKAVNRLGEGGFGTVFKGLINQEGSTKRMPVAVKTLNHEGFQGHNEWLAEVIYLGELRHPNLVKLVGYCIEDEQRLLVYEFMPRGSLERHLFRRQGFGLHNVVTTIDVFQLIRGVVLPWSVRMKILLGAAKGLAFLHEEAERPLIFRDFKTSNILLDEEYNAKLSDFGLAKDAPVGESTHISTRVLGTQGYAAPEYVMTGHLTSKSDVYSFGVVLLEMMTGRRAMERERPQGEQNLVEWARMQARNKVRIENVMDPKFRNEFSINASLIVKALRLAIRCVKNDPKARPPMSKVVQELIEIRRTPCSSSSASASPAMQARPFNRGNSNKHASASASASTPSIARNSPIRFKPSPMRQKYPLPVTKPSGGSGEGTEKK